MTIADSINATVREVGGTPQPMIGVVTENGQRINIPATVEQAQFAAARLYGMCKVNVTIEIADTLAVTP